MPDKALLIGINDYETVSSLRGCESDVRNMETLLTSLLGFNRRIIRTILNREAKKREIVKQMDWLFQNVRAGDRLVFHFSGHGSSIASEDGDEKDGTDELLCLADMNFRNPGTYLTDDELRQWTGRLPRGARLLVVLDCCHSGTGTRLVSRSPLDPPHAIVEKATTDRLVRTSRDLEFAADLPKLVREAFNPVNEHAVLARYAPPPPEIASRVAQLRSSGRGKRTLVVADLNHVLLAACRDDQTAADAYIGGSFNGAFTYNLCRALEALGGNADRQEIHRRVVDALNAGHFEQVPQFEAPAGPGTLFGGEPDVRPPVSDDPDPEQPESSERPATVTNEQAYALLQRLVDSGNPLGAEERRMALEILHRLVVPSGGLSDRLGRATAPRYLVYVHGICSHSVGYSDPWWEALQPHVNGVFGDGERDRQRYEVLWSELVNSTRMATSRGAEEREELRREILETLQERIDWQRLQKEGIERAANGTTVAAPQVDLERGMRDLPGVRCIDDFTIYMTDEEVRAQVLECFTQVIRPLLEKGAEIDLISHSWGTVVAYEGLRELEDAGFTRPQVRTLFTVGSALSIGPVRWRLRQANRDGRKPALVRRWVNLDATGDLVGGALIRHFRVDDEFLNLEPFGCEPNWLGIYNPSCAHSSYFQKGNERVNRSIFSRFIVE